jgi:hypothetical protein
MMCASPVFNPNTGSTVRRASMQATIASFRAGGIERWPNLKSVAKRRFAATASSVMLIEKASNVD